MKRVILSLVIILSTSSLFAQKSVDEIMDNFRGRDDVNVISISGSMFQMGSSFIQESDSEAKMAKDIAASIDEMNIVNTESKESSKELKKYVDKLIKKNKYEEMMTVDSEGEEIKFYGKIENNVIKEFFIFVEDKSDMILISMKGNIDPKNINEVMKKAEFN